MNCFKWSSMVGILVMASTLTLTGCGTAAKTASGPSVSSTVTYQVTIQNTTNTLSFTGATSNTNRTGLNFSRVAVLTHKTPGAMWDEAHPATAGIVHVSEWGKVDAEGVANGDLSLDGMNGNLISVNEGYSKVTTSGGVAAGTSTTFTIQVNSDYPYISLATMLAPSSDFFTGIYNVALVENGQFVSSKTVNLLGYSAESRPLSSVDLAVLKNSNNNLSVVRPTENVMLIGNSPRVPAAVKVGITPSTIFGTVTITKL